MGIDEDTSNDPGPLWEFVPIAHYTVPGLPASSAAATAWKSFKQIFRFSDKKSMAPVKEETNLYELPQGQMEHLVPPLNLNEAAKALDDSLKEWIQAKSPDQPVKFVIGQPHCGHADIVRQWGELHGAAIVASPTDEQILKEDMNWVDDWPASDRPWVLPDLERVYLRHVHGLTLVRKLLESAESGRLGRGIIGCDSWAWVYLKRIWPVPRPDALTLQAFDGFRLSRLFIRMISLQPGERIYFRNAATGNNMLTVPTNDAGPCAEIVKLAAHCRGNVGTAICYWRKRLRTEPDTDKTGQEETQEMPEPEAKNEEHVWVSAKLSESAVPMETDENTAFVLHTLLLHGGVSASLLAELLPLSYDHCMAILLRLRNSGIVKHQKKCWEVTELAYHTVRAFLRSYDYLVDDF
jgi:hypothetical protein